MASGSGDSWAVSDFRTRRAPRPPRITQHEPDALSCGFGGRCRELGGLRRQATPRRELATPRALPSAQLPTPRRSRAPLRIRPPRGSGRRSRAARAAAGRVLPLSRGAAAPSSARPTRLPRQRAGRDDPSGTQHPTQPGCPLGRLAAEGAAPRALVRRASGERRGEQADDVGARERAGEGVRVLLQGVALLVQEAVHLLDLGEDVRARHRAGDRPE